MEAYRWARQNARRDRRRPGSMSAGSKGPLLQHRRLGQRTDRGPGGARAVQVSVPLAQVPAGRSGRTGIHPLLGQRGTLDLSALLDALRASGDDCDDQSPLWRLDAGVWRRAVDSGAPGSAYTPRSHLGVRR